MNAYMNIRVERCSPRVPMSDIPGTVVPNLSTERTSIIFWPTKIDTNQVLK